MWEIIKASLETMYMISAAGGIAMIIGIPIGILLCIMNHEQLYPHPMLYKVLGSVLNTLRAIPFVILMLLCMPITKTFVGTTIGTTAAIVPLSIAAIPLLARLTEQVFSKVSYNLIEMGVAMGATLYQMIRYILWVEALPSLIQSIGTMMINLVSYSAMAGVIGGGGLGDLAIRYGYHRFDTLTLFITTILLIGLVQCIHVISEYVSQSFVPHA